MTAFTVHEQPDAAGSLAERAEALVFVGEGFSWRAALFGPFYLLLRGEWLALAAYIAAAGLAAGVLSLAGAEPQWTGLISIVLNIIVGFEAGEIRRSSLARAGWREVGTVGGRNVEDAEYRFFEDWLAGRTANADASIGSVGSAHLSTGPSNPVHSNHVLSRPQSLFDRLSDRLRLTAPKT